MSPNLLTIARMLLALPMASLLIVDPADLPSARTLALAIFLFAAASDWADGAWARKTGRTSRLGAALDPIADKILLAAAFAGLIAADALAGAGVSAAVLILAREFLVAGLREAVARHGGDLRVTALAKWKTAVQLTAAGFLIAVAPDGALWGYVGAGAKPLADGLLWAAAALTLWTGADYCLRASAFLNDKRGDDEANGANGQTHRETG